MQQGVIKGIGNNNFVLTIKDNNRYQNFITGNLINIMNKNLNYQIVTIDNFLAIVNNLDYCFGISMVNLNIRQELKNKDVIFFNSLTREISNYHSTISLNLGDFDILKEMYDDLKNKQFGLLTFIAETYLENVSTQYLVADFLIGLIEKSLNPNIFKYPELKEAFNILGKSTIRLFKSDTRVKNYNDYLYFPLYSRNTYSVFTKTSLRREHLTTTETVDYKGMVLDKNGNWSEKGQGRELVYTVRLKYVNSEVICLIKSDRLKKILDIMEYEKYVVSNNLFLAMVRRIEPNAIL